MSRAGAIPAGIAPPRPRALWRVAALCVGALAVAGCKRTDEAELRARLAGWVPLGETVSFSATRDCAAGVFELRGTRVAARMRVANSVREAATILDSRDEVAIDAPGQSPDSALLDLIELDRATGMRMRLAALEGRTCMETATEAAFAAALVNPRARLLMDRGEGVLALMDGEGALLVVAMGAK